MDLWGRGGEREPGAREFGRDVLAAGRAGEEGREMRKIFLIAINHLRDQRWILLTMFGYVLFMSTVMGVIVHRPNYQDASFFVEQQMWFSVLFSMFLATPAVNTDMRTRRMQAILSKAVERWQYLLGILLGITMAIAAYCCVVGLLGLMFSTRAGHPLPGIA